MTLLTALTWSVLRAITVASIALVAACACPAQTGLKRSRRMPLLVIALSPLFVPELLIGFTYRLTAARIAQSAATSDALTELLYSGILLGRATAVIIAVRLILPGSTVTTQAMHSWKLLRPDVRRRPHQWSGTHVRDIVWAPAEPVVHKPDQAQRQTLPAAHWWWTYLRLLAAGPFRAPLIGWCVAVLLCFQEFETAALVQIDRHPISWPVWLFDAHAAGEPLTRSLVMLAIPLVIELSLLWPVLWLLRSGGAANGRGNPRYVCGDGSPVRRLAGSALSVGWLLVVVTTFLLWPIKSNITDLGKGFAALWNQPPLLSGSLAQIATSLGFAVGAAVVALQGAVVLRSVNKTWLTVVALLPGLLGSLVLSLLLLAVFQSSVANWLYDSWVPMLLGLSLLMLPRAYLLAAVLEAVARPQAVHSAKLLLNAKSRGIRRIGRNLIWRLVEFRWLLAGAVLVHWSFWDVTVAAILRPLRFEPVVTRLYNEMHYGRTETLTAIALLSLAIPWLVAGVAMQLRKLAV